MILFHGKPKWHGCEVHLFGKEQTMRRILKTLVLMCFLPVAVYAGGGKQIVTQTADGIDIWQTEFDVS
jgi:hypothetical protein